MNVKNNKGYFAIDASVAIIVLLIVVPFIAGMIYNVTKSNSGMSRKTEAVNIAINSIEAIKGIGIENLNDANTFETNVKNAIKSRYDNLNEEDMTIEKASSTYQISFEIKDYASTEEGMSVNAVENKVKIIKIIVKYRMGRTTKEVTLNTAIS